MKHTNVDEILEDLYATHIRRQHGYKGKKDYEIGIAKQQLYELLEREAETLYEYYEGDNYAQRKAIPLDKLKELFNEE